MYLLSSDSDIIQAAFQTKQTLKMKSKVGKYLQSVRNRNKKIYLLKGKSTDSNLAGNILIFSFNISHQSHQSSKYEIFIITGHCCALTMCLYQCLVFPISRVYSCRWRTFFYEIDMKPAQFLKHSFRLFP